MSDQSSCPKCQAPLTGAPASSASCPACGETLSWIAPDPSVPHTASFVPGTGADSSPAAPAAPAAPRVPGGILPGYEIFEELGRGGMGVVYRARQVKLDRVVALKMILAGGHASPSALARFRTEAEAVARLQHSGIVQIHEVGEHEGLPFVVFEFCAGGSLSSRLKGKPLPAQEAARVAEKLARAIQAAHQERILHRDLKPANVLLSAANEPKIADFGLAKKLDDESDQTRSGAVVGTPSYMPPEQASGRKHELGPAMDIYSLGAILYEMLTGRPPFQAASAVETLRQVVDCEPARPRLLNPQIDRDLEAICLKCLDKDAPRRYASAGALADDLRRFLDQEPVEASVSGLLDRVGRALTRTRSEQDFAAYSGMLRGFAVVVLCREIAFYLFIQSRLDIHWMLAIHAVTLVLVLFIFARSRTETVFPTSVSEQIMWTIWLGYIAACVVFRQATRLERGLSYAVEVQTYPGLTVLTGFAFCVMGATYWGPSYLLGGLFFPISLLMSISPELAPLEFGLLWFASLFLIAGRLRKLAVEATVETHQ